MLWPISGLPTLVVEKCLRQDCLSLHRRVYRSHVVLGVGCVVGVTRVAPEIVGACREVTLRVKLQWSFSWWDGAEAEFMESGVYLTGSKISPQYNKKIKK